MNYLSPKLSIFYAISGLLNIIIIENHSPKQYTYYYNESNFSSVVAVFWLSCLCTLFYLFTCLLVPKDVQITWLSSLPNIGAPDEG